MPSLVFAPDTKAVMICGSQQWSALNNGAVYKFVDALIANLSARGIVVHVGDNPQGVDNHVHTISYARKIPIRVYGIDHKPRSLRAQTSSFATYEQVVVPRYGEARDRFAARDLAILRAASHVLCIWNGKSPGTRRIFEAASVYGKRADMAVWHIEEDQLVWTRRNYAG